MKPRKKLTPRQREAKRASIHGVAHHKRWDCTKACAPWHLSDTLPPAVTMELRSPQHIVLIGDIVTGFEAYGPFNSGHDAIEWKGSDGVREIAHGQWYLMQLKEPIRGNKP